MLRTLRLGLAAQRLTGQCPVSSWGEKYVAGQTFLGFWYYHIPNFVLAALMYTLLGRAALGLMVDADSPNYIWRFFCRLTDPVIAVVALVTPKAVPPVIIWLFGVVWLFWLRVGFLYLFLVAGVAPRAS